MPPMQGAIIDLGTVAGMASVNFSFILPFVCFCIIAVYGFRTIKPVLK
jgi:FHS family L-fucose permease-like MFS transporter